VLGEAAAARESVDVDKAERHYQSAIALAGELEMRPLLARSHLGIARLYVCAGDRNGAEDHILAATRLFITLDMPFWLRRAVSSVSELGRLLIVAPDHQNLYDYLIRVVAADGPIRVIMDAPGVGSAVDDDQRRQQIAWMLQSHGLSIAGRD
jgi:hypothetical protein